MNAPLQQRAIVLDIDTTRANTFPSDYDTDIEFDWSNPSNVSSSYFLYSLLFSSDRFIC